MTCSKHRYYHYGCPTCRREDTEIINISTDYSSNTSDTSTSNDSDSGFSGFDGRKWFRWRLVKL